jgi:predicted dehydrogenase
VFLMTANRLHNEPGTVAVLDHIRNDAIGRPLLFQSVFSFQATAGNHRLQAASWGGPLQDVGVYCVNAARHSFAEAMAMVHRPSDDPRFREVEASVAALLRSLRVVSHNSSPASEPPPSTVIGLSERRARSNLTPASGSRLRLRRGGEVRETQFPQIDHFGAQVQYFSDCIKTGTPPEANAEEGLADLRALIAIEKAALTGQPQTIASPPRARHPTPDMVRVKPVTDRRLVF